MLETITEFIANSGRIAAPIVALLASWTFYGVLGRRVLGVAADY